MRSMFRSVLVAFVAVLALSAVAASSALATPEWLLKEKPVTKSTPVTLSKGTITLEDNGATGGPIEASCSSSGKGTVAPGGAGTVTEFKLAKCTKIKTGQCKREEAKEEEDKEWVKSLHLPWKTQLGEYKGGVIDTLKPGASEGEIAWEFECTNILGGKTKDECRGLFYNTELSANLSEGVAQRFVGFEDNERFKCSLGSGGTGEWLGKDVLVGPAGETLSFKP